MPYLDPGAPASARRPAPLPLPAAESLTSRSLPRSRLTPARYPAPPEPRTRLGAPIGMVATMLTVDERLRVDAAGAGLYRTLHRDSLDAVMRDLRERRVGAVLLSVDRYRERDTPSLVRMVREFPGVPAVALVSTVGQATSRTVLRLGNSGVRKLVDVRQASGWQELRSVLMADSADELARTALAQIALDLAGAPPECLRFFELLFARPVRVGTVRALAAELGTLPSTLMSRFFRLRLPAPKRYLAMARLVEAARLFENTGLTVGAVSNHLEYSSPQSFGRHIRCISGFTAARFRARYDGEGMLGRFRDELVLPYRDVLRTFNPLGGTAVRLPRATPRPGAATARGP